MMLREYRAMLLLSGLLGTTPSSNHLPCQTSGDKKLQKILPQAMPLFSTALSKHAFECPNSWLHFFFCSSTICVLIGIYGQPTSSYFSRIHQGMPLHRVLVSQSSEILPYDGIVEEFITFSTLQFTTTTPEFQELGCVFRKHLIQEVAQIVCPEMLKAPQVQRAHLRLCYPSIRHKCQHVIDVQIL